MEEKMVMKKFTLGALILVCPWIMSAKDSVDQVQQSLDQIQQQQQSSSLVFTVDQAGDIAQRQQDCFDLENAPQRPQFGIEFNCERSWTEWVELTKRLALPEDEELWGSVSMKNGKYNVEPCKSCKENYEQQYCTVLAQWETVVPSQTVTGIKSCKQVTPEMVAKMCHAKTSSYCNDHAGKASQSQSQSQDFAACTKTQINLVDTCADYAQVHSLGKAYKH